MKILVSGASGAFGSEFVKRLDRYETVSLRYGRMEEQHRTKLSECEVFVHCGGLLKGNRDELLESNTLLTKEILDHLGKENPHVHFVYLSSMSILRKKNKVAARDYLEFWEMTDYALSKYISEILCSRSGISTTVVRFSTLFCRNPARDGLSRLVFDAVTQKKITILNNGKAKRDYIPLDIATGYVTRILGDESLFGRTLNIVSGKETSFREIADFLSSKISPLEIEDLQKQQVDCVPTDFDAEDIRSLGMIDFDLYDRIEEYKNSL